MKDTVPQRDALISHLEAALTLSEELAQPTTGYLIERALDEARAHLFGLESKREDVKALPC